MLYLHFVLIGCLVLGTGVVAFRFSGKSERSIGKVLKEMLPLLLIGLLCQFLLSANGTPRIEWILPALCAFVVGMTCRSDQILRRFRNVMIPVSILLCASFVTIVHSENYTAAPQFRVHISEVRQKSKLRTIARELQAENSAGTLLQPGPVGTTLDAEASREWHTWFSGIYRVNQHQQTVWYAGGSVDDALALLKVQ